MKITNKILNNLNESDLNKIEDELGELYDDRESDNTESSNLVKYGKELLKKAEKLPDSDEKSSKGFTKKQMIKFIKEFIDSF